MEAVLPLAMAMVAGAVVLGGDTARTSVRAEAVGSVFLILALLPRLAQVRGAQGNFTELACVGGSEREVSLRGTEAPVCPEGSKAGGRGFLTLQAPVFSWSLLGHQLSSLRPCPVPS